MSTLGTDNRQDLIVALTRLGEGLTGTYRSQSVVDQAADAIQTLLDPDRLLIVTHEEKDDISSVAHARNWPDARPDHPLIQRLQKRGALKIPDSGPADPKVGTWMGAPIGAAGQTFGTVALGRDGGPAFSDQDLQLLRLIIAQAATAFVNSHLLLMLENGKREWERTVDALPQAFCIVDARGRIRRANRAFAKLVGVPVTALVDRPWHSLMPEDSTDAVARALANAESGTPFELKMASRLFTTTAHRTGLDWDDAAVLVLDDQTDKRTLQDQVVQAAKMSAIGQLIAGIAHDLNNPLASVVGFAEYLVQTSEDIPTRIVEPLRAIHMEAERASKIVRSLLAFARKQESDRQALQVGPILESTLTILKNQLLTYRVEATLSIAPDLPPLLGNATQLQQVFVNVITNAAQAIHTSGIGGAIRISAERWLDGVAVTIEDDGPDIPANIAQQIFEPFFTTKAEGDGTGLGLSICHGIVTEHGGRIHLTDRPDRGAAFRIELPGGIATDVFDEHRATDTTALTILVVDDEPHILHYMRAALEEWGHTVAIARDGREGMHLATSEPFDVIITDLRMPDIGGREFFETLQEKHPEIARHVVFSTGDTVGGDALSFLESVEQPHLKKPFSLNELRSVLPVAAEGV